MIMTLSNSIARFIVRAAVCELRDIGFLAGAACCFQKGMERHALLKGYLADSLQYNYHKFIVVYLNMNGSHPEKNRREYGTQRFVPVNDKQQHHRFYDKI